MPGARGMWIRHGVVEVSRLASIAGEPFVVVQPVGWRGEAGWIAQHATEIHLRPLSSIETCEGWLARLRDPPAKQPPGDLQTRIKRRFNTLELGTPEQLVDALAESYAELYRPDNEDLRLLDQLEACVLVEIACVLDRDVDQLRTALRVGPRFAPDAPSSGEIAVREREAAAKQEPDASWFASFECGGRLHVTDVDDCSVYVAALGGPWRARMLDDGHWIVVARAHERDLPLSLADAELLARGNGAVYPFAVLDGTALQDPTIEDELISCLSNDVKGRGAAVFAREPVTVHAWMTGGVCYALQISIEPPPVDDEDDITDLLEFPKAGQYVLRYRHGVVHVEDVLWDDDYDGILIRTRSVEPDGERVDFKTHGLDKQLRPLIDAATAEGALAATRRSHSPRPPGSPEERDRRYRDTINLGTYDEQVAALAHIYSEPHRPEPGELETLEALERLVLGEIAHVLDEPRDAVIARVRAQHPRFSADAPLASEIVEHRGGPALPAGHWWISTFDVARTLQITDLTANTLSFEAVKGAWIAMRRDGAIIVVASGHLGMLPLESKESATFAIPGNRDFALAVLDAGALESSLISNALIEGTHEDVMGTGVAWLAKSDAVEVRVWRSGGVCIAIEMRTQTVVS